MINEKRLAFDHAGKGCEKKPPREKQAGGGGAWMSPKRTQDETVVNIQGY